MFSPWLLQSPEGRLHDPGGLQLPRRDASERIQKAGDDQSSHSDLRFGASSGNVDPISLGVWTGGRRLAKPFLTPEQGFDKVGEGSGCAPGGDYAYKNIYIHTHHLILIVCGLMETREGQQLYM